jgi:hypothetical protein
MNLHRGLKSERPSHCRVTSIQNTTRTESVGSLSLVGGANTMTLDNTDATTALTTFGLNRASFFSRSDNATLLVRWPNLDGSPTASTDATPLGLAGFPL